MRSRRNKAKADPTAIATMAAVESFLDFLRTGLGGTDGDGAGDGKNGLHGGNGPPQRSRFPANEEAGNFDSVFGIEPLSLLLDTLKPAKSTLMLGNLPENSLFSRKSPVRWVRLLTENGIEPLKLLEERSRRLRRVKRVKLAGKSPENLLSWR